MGAIARAVEGHCCGEVERPGRVERHIDRRRGIDDRTERGDAGEGVGHLAVDRDVVVGEDRWRAGHGQGWRGRVEGEREVRRAGSAVAGPVAGKEMDRVQAIGRTVERQLGGEAVVARGVKRDRPRRTRPPRLQGGDDPPPRGRR